MATITGLTAEAMQDIVDATVTDADVVGGHLILTLHDGSTIDVGNVVGPAGAPGTPASNLGKGGAFPGGATDGDLFIRTDQVGDPLYKYTDGAWVVAAGGLQKVTAFPGAPADGDGVVRTDLNGSPIFMYSTENGWEQQPRMGAVTPPTCKVGRVSGQSFTNLVGVAFSFDSESEDTDTMHDLVTNTDRVTIKTPGRYLITVHVEWNSNASGYRETIISKNGVTNLRVANNTPVSGDTTTQTLSLVETFAAGEYFRVVGYQSSGGALAAAPYVTTTWLGGPGQTVDERGVPAAKAYNSAGVSGPNNVYTLMPFDSELYDTEGIHDLVTNTTRLTIKTAGLYTIRGRGNFSSNGSGYRGLQILKNGSGTGVPYSQQPSVSGDNTTIEVTATLVLVAGDYIELQYFQNSGGSLTIGGGSGGGTTLEAIMVASGKIVTPYTRTRKSAVQSIANSTEVAISWDIEDADNDGIHDTVTNNHLFVCRTAGVYLARASIQYATNNNANRELRIYKNGSTMIGYEIRAANGTDLTNIYWSDVIELAVGDTIEVRTVQFSGGALNVVASGTRDPGFAMVKIGAPIVGQSLAVLPPSIIVAGTGAMPYLNGWATYTAAPKVWKDPSGTLVTVGPFSVDGSAKTGDIAFQLPVGFRPSQSLYIPAKAQNAAFNSATDVEYLITSGGDVYLRNVNEGSLPGASAKAVMCNSLTFAL